MKQYDKKISIPLPSNQARDANEVKLPESSNTSSEKIISEKKEYGDFFETQKQEKILQNTKKIEIPIVSKSREIKQNPLTNKSISNYNKDTIKFKFNPLLEKKIQNQQNISQKEDNFSVKNKKIIPNKEINNVGFDSTAPEKKESVQPDNNYKQRSISPTRELDQKMLTIDRPDVSNKTGPGTMKERTQAYRDLTIQKNIKNDSNLKILPNTKNIYKDTSMMISAKDEIDAAKKSDSGNGGNMMPQQAPAQISGKTKSVASSGLGQPRSDTVMQITMTRMSHPLWMIQGLIG